MGFVYSRFASALCSADSIDDAREMLDEVPNAVRTIMQGQYKIARATHKLIAAGKGKEANTAIDVALEEHLIADRIAQSLRALIPNGKPTRAAAGGKESDNGTTTRHARNPNAVPLQEIHRAIFAYFLANPDRTIEYQEIIDALDLAAKTDYEDLTFLIQREMRHVLELFTQSGEEGAIVNKKGKGYEYATVKGTGIPLEALRNMSANEIKALKFFYAHDRQVVTPDMLGEAVWKKDAYTWRDLATLVERVRSKLPKHSLLVTLWNKEGYLFNKETNVPGDMGLAFEQYILLVHLLRNLQRELPRDQMEEALTFAREQLQERTELKANTLYNAVAHLKERLGKYGEMDVRMEQAHKQTLPRIEGCTLKKWKPQWEVQEKAPVIARPQPPPTKGK